MSTLKNWQYLNNGIALLAISVTSLAPHDSRDYLAKMASGQMLQSAQAFLNSIYNPPKV